MWMRGYTNSVPLQPCSPSITTDAHHPAGEAGTWSSDTATSCHSQRHDFIDIRQDKPEASQAR